ncbi:hypothetical protein BD413DRAFT_579466 [Trametes elegans]|nr:hypothetical protein BD413DRAFT_579466 [Trametes elegans]
MKYNAQFYRYSTGHLSCTPKSDEQELYERHEQGRRVCTSLQRLPRVSATLCRALRAMRVVLVRALESPVALRTLEVPLVVFCPAVPQEPRCVRVSRSLFAREPGREIPARWRRRALLKEAREFGCRPGRPPHRLCSACTRPSLTRARIWSRVGRCSLWGLVVAFDMRLRARQVRRENNVAPPHPTPPGHGGGPDLSGQPEFLPGAADAVASRGRCLLSRRFGWSSRPGHAGWRRGDGRRKGDGDGGRVRERVGR